MKKIYSFFIALGMFLILVTVLHFYGVSQINMKTDTMSTWNNVYKYDNRQAVAVNLDKDTIPVFGSSEFNHGVKSPYHPKALFKNQKCTPMIMGSAFSQCMTHTIALGSLEPAMENRKAIILLSPQWFSPSGIKPEAFALRFSESNYIGLLKNKNLSTVLKGKITSRANALLVKNQSLQKKADTYNKIYLYHNASKLDITTNHLQEAFLHEKNRLSILTGMQLSGITPGEKKKISEKAPDWDRLEGEAEKFAKHRTTNKLYVYDRLLKKQLRKKKRNNILQNYTYAKSPEYDDFRLFLDVCKERNIEPLVIMLPLNGYWYDHTGFPKENRDIFYTNIKKITKKYNVNAIDFSKNEYTPYFMQDGAHLSSKGWVKINEEIYKFYKENN